ncbi:MAG: major facilitator superfamily 1, partial [Thermomicrobiales bacterium]|nr:major facilitator superfamily 1 [Thermomicrobiales bacterium]
FGVAALAVAFGGGLGSYAGGLLYDLGRGLELPALPWLIFAMIGLIAAAGLSWTLLGSGRSASDAVRLGGERRVSG